MTTIHDVARAAGVSAMTVSNVLNHKPHVRDTTRQKVEAAMSLLDYRVNVVARNLRARRTFTIGLAVAEIDRPYWGQLAARIIQEAAGHQLQVVVEQTGASRQSELDALLMSRNRMYDGLILSTVGLGNADVDKLRTDYPIVILGERIFAGPVDHVAMANVDGSAAATKHLIDQGCRRIAIVNDDHRDEINMSSLRFAGYRQSLEAAGISLDNSLVCAVPMFTMESGRHTVERLVEIGIDFDGIFCPTDSVALGALRGLADAGLEVPGQVKVMGFDNIDEGRYSVPSLSTVDPDHDLMARTAVDLLVNRIESSGTPLPPVEFVSTYRVIPRGSTTQQ